MRPDLAPPRRAPRPAAGAICLASGFAIGVGAARSAPAPGGADAPPAARAAAP
jgi:hypothetical protein